MTSLQDARIKEFETELRKRGENEKIDWKEMGIRLTHQTTIAGAKLKWKPQYPGPG